MNQQDFIAMIAPAAQEFQSSSSAFASVTIAQACLETGYGSFIPHDDATGQCSYNLFGVKEFGNGQHVTCTTWEVEGGRRVTIKAKFRAYTSYTESIADHAAFLLQPRYAPVLAAATPREAAERLHACGYATDPEYGPKLNWIIDRFELTKYDDTPKEDDFLMKLTDAQKSRLTALLDVLDPNALEQITPSPKVPEWAEKGVTELEELGASFGGGGKLPAVWQIVRMHEQAGIYRDALAWRKSQSGVK